MSINLNYDINLFYQAFTSTIHSLWPIMAPAFAIMLVGLLIGGIITVFRKWQDR